MSIHNMIQICLDDHTIKCDRRGDTDWVVITDGKSRITMEAEHVRALAAALDAYEMAEVTA